MALATEMPTFRDVLLPSSGASITISSTPSTLDTSVTLVPDRLHVCQGSTVNVSVDITLLSPITMAAISTNIFYNPDVFDFDATSAVVKGSLLTHDWDLFGGEHAEGVLSDLRVGGIDLNIDPLYETLWRGLERCSPSLYR